MRITLLSGHRTVNHEPGRTRRKAHKTRPFLAKTTQKRRKQPDQPECP